MTPRFLKALKWASELHRLQRRKGPAESVPGKCPRLIPYVNHLIAVTEMLGRVGGVTDEDVLIAALLHDAIEDTDATIQDVEERFGERVSRIVAEVSDDRSLDQQTRKLAQVEHAQSLSREAKLVKLADKIHNCSDLKTNPPSGWSDQRIEDYRQWSLAVVNGLIGVSPSLEALFDDVIAERFS